MQNYIYGVKKLFVGFIISGYSFPVFRLSFQRPCTQVPLFHPQHDLLPGLHIESHPKLFGDGELSFPAYAHNLLINSISVIWKYEVLLFRLGGTGLFPIMPDYRKYGGGAKDVDCERGFKTATSLGAGCPTSAGSGCPPAGKVNRMGNCVSGDEFDLIMGQLGQPARALRAIRSSGWLGVPIS